MNKKELTRLVELAIDRNMVVYDADAKVGEPTTRLVNLLKVTAKRNAEQKLTSMIVPKSFVNIEKENSLYKLLYPVCPSKMLPVTTIYGIKIYYSDFDIKKIVDKLNGVIQGEDKYAVVMFNDNKPIAELTEKDVLLGSY